MAKVIIEAAITGNRPRSDTPKLPVLTEEIAEAAAECHAAGAAIVHIHSRDPVTTETTPDNSEFYAKAIRAIRARCPVLIWPSCPAGDSPPPTRERYKHIIELSADPETMPDLGIMDMGSLNWTKVKDGVVGGHCYINTIQQLTEIAALIDELGFPRSRIQMFDPNCIRTAIAFVRHGVLREPLASTLYFGGGEVLIGMPPTAASLAAYVEMLKAVRGIWFASVIGGDVLEFAPLVIAAGGHLRVGLEDYPYKEQGYPSNADLVRRAATLVTAMGHEVATVDDARELLEI